MRRGVSMSEVRVRWIGRDGVVRSGTEDSLQSADGPWMWIDISDPDQETLDRISIPLGLHPLAVEDSYKPQARPKLDLYPEGSFLVWLGPRLESDGSIAHDELDCYLSAGHLVTIHRGRAAAIDALMEDALRAMPQGPDWVLHGILDRMVDSLMPVVDAIGDRIESVEDRMLDDPRHADLEELYLIRRQLLLMHRSITPQRDMVRALARERDFVSEDAYRYFDDVVDHLTYVEQALDTYREVVSAVMDIYLSAQSNRLNEVMKVLTVVTVILGAATLISGIYGMNLIGGMWPSPSDPWGFGAAILSMLAVGTAMSVYFRRKNWW